MNATIRHIALLLLLLSVLTGCRRDLWVYTDQFSQVELVTDWSEAHIDPPSEKPGGMTWWFMKDDRSYDHKPRKTAEVTRTKIDVPRGIYSGVVFDWSTGEYSHQEFLGDNIDNALVHLLPAADQPEADDELYGAIAVGDFAEAIPIHKPTGMYQVAAAPQIMNADTLHHINIINGFSDERILWDEADRYRVSEEEMQILYAYPKPIVWKLNVRVYVRHITYYGGVTGSVVGPADGCWLGKLRHTATPCLQRLGSWDRPARMNTTDDLGLLSTTINSFGLQDLGMPSSPYDTRADSPAWNEHLRLNLKITLRDQKTNLYYHYDVDSSWMTIDADHLVVTIEIPIEYSPDLPYVEEADKAGFGADVTPWADGGTADETM